MQSEKDTQSHLDKEGWAYANGENADCGATIKVPLPFHVEPNPTGTEIHEDAPKPKRLMVSKENEWRLFRIGTPIKVNGRIFLLRKITDKDLVFRPAPLEESK